MTADLASRIKRAQEAMSDAGVDALVVTPGPDLRYLTGYAAMPLERLTAIVLRTTGDPVLLAPELEAAEAQRSPAGLAGMEVRATDETADVYAIVADLIGSADAVAVDDHMWASRVFALQAVVPEASFAAAGPLLSRLRMIKGADEIASLRRAGAAIDRVHSRMSEFLKVGLTERAAGAAIAQAIVDEGHQTADFVIVGSGPNGASPHHSLSDRVIGSGDPVVVDIGGSTSDGYCSDSTRTYAVGARPPSEFADFYAVLRDAQHAQCESARPGVTAEAVDRVGREMIAAAGYGDNFIHRTGHGIGLETHEEPYIVAGNDLALEPGMAFSIEPGIYLPGRHGARIEDIVVTTADGVERLNHTTRELTVLEG
jgi:Xaa-Pro aminopeptidase